MGDRSNIKVVYPKGEVIYLYGHWLGKENQTIVDDAIAEGQRLSDPEYFTRILFSKMIANDVTGSTGFGISPYLTDNDYGNPIVVVDYSKNGYAEPEVYEEEA